MKKRRIHVLWFLGIGLASFLFFEKDRLYWEFNTQTIYEKYQGLSYIKVRSYHFPISFSSGDSIGRDLQFYNEIMVQGNMGPPYWNTTRNQFFSVNEGERLRECISVVWADDSTKIFLKCLTKDEEYYKIEFDFVEESSPIIFARCRDQEAKE